MRKPMTIRLQEEALNQLGLIAASNGVTRQDLVEQILVEYTHNNATDHTNDAISYVPNHLLEFIKVESEKLAVGTEVSLKKIVGDAQWSELADSTRRVFGKQFRDMVNDGAFPRLKVGRKKSNNEQQYIALK